MVHEAHQIQTIRLHLLRVYTSKAARVITIEIRYHDLNIGPDEGGTRQKI